MAPAPLTVVLDFDGTITQEDTIDTLTRYAAHYSANKGVHNSSETPVSATSLMADWEDSVIKPYLRDLEEFERQYRWPKEKRLTWELEEAYLEDLKSVEERSIKRVEASPIFKGFVAHDFRTFGQQAIGGTITECPVNTDTGFDPSFPESSFPSPRDELPSVKLRKGFVEFLNHIPHQRMDWKLGIVSVNWSTAFIQGVFLGLVTRFEIFANQIDSDPNDSPTITGPLGLKTPLTTAKDKALVLGRMTERLSPRELLGPVVYIGDSKTDLLCLRDADLGIVIVDAPGQSSLLSTLQRLGEDVPHVGQASHTGTLAHYVWARDFSEIIDSGILEKLALKVD
ncbi:HAD-like domain containing protein [Naviculisporaceae sp. PSN 640]